MRMLRYGHTGALLEFDTGAEVTRGYRALRAAALPGVVELVPAARTILVAVDAGAAVPVDRLRELLATPGPDTEAAAPEAQLVTLPVRYDGADLDLVARTAGLDTDEVVRLHTGAEYTVAFCGFVPGFGYLVGLPEPLRQPRLDEARAEVPAGSIGVAGEFTGVYPRASPGGWRLLGRTEEVLFDAAREPPARLTPGTRVRFSPQP